MARSRKRLSIAKFSDKTPLRASRLSQTRKANHLKDDVYREMLLLEVNRPGAEMGLALALLRAIVQSESLTGQADYKDWLKSICPVGLKLIEASLGERYTCEMKES